MDPELSSIIEQMMAGAVTPAGLGPGLPRSGGVGGAVVPAGLEGGAQPQPRIRMTGAVKSNVGGQPIATEPADGTDPYSGVPRIQPRTGLRRFGYNAASGIAASPWNATPLSAFADSYLGAQNAEQAQTQQERTAQIDEINRQLERQKYADTQERQSRLDAADLDVKASTAEFNRARASGKIGAGGGVRLTDGKIEELLLQKEKILRDEAGLNIQNGRLANDPEARAAALAKVKEEFDAYEIRLRKMQTGGGDAAEIDDGGITQADAGDLALDSGDTQVVPGQPGGSPPAKTRGIVRQETIETFKPDSAPKGAIPDNISGDGSLRTPFRVKNAKDPTLKAKIKVGDHFFYLNPQTGREEIRVRDR